MPRVVVLWHRTGFIRRLSPTWWCIGCYTLARHLTRLGKTTFPTITIATVPRYTHAVRQPMPTTHDGATTSLICGKGDSKSVGLFLKGLTFSYRREPPYFPYETEENWKPYIHVPCAFLIHELFPDDASTFTAFQIQTPCFSNSKPHRFFF